MTTLTMSTRAEPSIELRCPDCSKLILLHTQPASIVMTVKCPRCKATWQAIMESS